MKPSSFVKGLQTLFLAWVFPWVPKRLMSRGVGLLMRVPLPKVLGRSWWLKGFAGLFRIQREEAELDLNSYPTLDAYFTRRLKPGLRPIQGPFVHPVDGVCTERGPIERGDLIQAKGWPYSMAEFLGEKRLADVYLGGSFLTYYLCPADYHRVHAPAAGELISACHIPGLLWPVNAWSVHNIRRLFCLNERVVLNFTSKDGPWSLVMVGATNVGQMSLNHDPSIITNRWLWHEPTERHYSPAPQIKAGEELGMFHLGSTVICLFSRGFKGAPVRAGKPTAVKVGQAVGTLADT